MKKVLASIVCASALLVPNTSVYAAEETTEMGAGITPDKITYITDTLFEDIQLSFTYDDEQKADLLIDITEERLSEATEMAEQGKSEFVETAIEGYLETIDEAQNQVLDVITDENIGEEVKEDLIDELENISVVDDIVKENLEDDQKEQIEENTEEVSYAANVVADIDVETVKTLRDKGFGFGKIAYINSLSTISGKSVDELASLVVDDGKGLGELSKELGISPSQIRSNSKSKEKSVKKENIVNNDDVVVETSVVDISDNVAKTNVNNDVIKANTSTLIKEIDKTKNKEKEQLNKNEEVKKQPEINKEQVKLNIEDEKKPVKIKEDKEKEEIVKDKKENKDK
jgi:hypothetical protein